MITSTLKYILIQTFAIKKLQMECTFDNFMDTSIVMYLYLMKYMKEFNAS